MVDSQHDTKPKRPESLPRQADLPRPGHPSGGFAPLEPPVVYKRKRDEIDSRPGGCLIPAWSLLLMLITVFGCAFGLLAAAIALGGDAAPGGAPQIVLVPAQVTPTNPLDAFFTTPTPTLFTGDTLGGVDFALQGPTLAPVIFTPTPMGIAVGVTVLVDVDGGLNVRPQPGVDNVELFRANYNDQFTVVDGPRNENGLTWWLIQDPFDPNRGGWAAGEFLRVLPPQ
ncbi:MAG: SH3 domain-containing protein [bacterium]|nr:SH3 domain-containing protein [bacterium]